MSDKCPTCGSDSKKRRGCNSAYDAELRIRGNITKRADVLRESSFNAKARIWYCGECPDAWHDYERRQGERRKP